MEGLYIRTIEEFIEDTKEVQSKIIEPLLTYVNTQNVASETESWAKSLPALAQVLSGLKESIRKQVEICLEANYASFERIDATLIGLNRKGQPALLIIENKQWTDLKKYKAIEKTNDRLVDPRHKNVTTLHPSAQARNYRHLLNSTNKYIQEHHVHLGAFVFMHNAGVGDIDFDEGVFDERFASLYHEDPIFVCGDDLLKEREEWIVRKYIEDFFTTGQSGLAEAIFDSEVRYSKELIEAITKPFLNPTGMYLSLTEHQQKLFEDIISAVFGEEKKVFIVQGCAGTGKSYLAVCLLAQLYQYDKTGGTIVAKYFEKNRDVRKVLAKKYEFPANVMTGRIGASSELVDCMICDEAHRMQEKTWNDEDDLFIKTFIDKSRVSVFFCDEDQSVNVNDFVTENEIEKAVNEMYEEGTVKVICKNLNEQKRMNGIGGNAFSEFVHHMLYETGYVPDGEIIKLLRTGDYHLELVERPETLFAKIREQNRHEETLPSRVIAGKGQSQFTEKKWNNWSWVNKDNNVIEKTIGPLYDGHKKEDFFSWNKRYPTQEDCFALDHDSIDQVGCIDTVQGIDFDYTGIIIAPDLYYDNNTQSVKVNLKGHQWGDSDLLGTKTLPKQKDRLIRNAYYVLLTRAHKGCYIYCCDKELEKQLNRCIPFGHWYSGTVKSYNLEKGFGFISDDVTGKNIYVQYTDIESKNSYRILEKGQRVQYQTIANDKGLVAIHVHVECKSHAEKK